MALKQTTALPLSLTHPRVGHTNFQRDTQTMIDKLYNDIRQNIQGATLVGLLADMPIAGNPGRTFFATDTNGFFEDNGTVWTQINSSGAGVTFAHLPASPILGTLAVVTDSTTAVWGATIAGTGGNTVLAWFNGSVWTVVGK